MEIANRATALGAVTGTSSSRDACLPGKYRARWPPTLRSAATELWPTTRSIWVVIQGRFCLVQCPSAIAPVTCYQHFVLRCQTFYQRQRVRFTASFTDTIGLGMPRGEMLLTFDTFEQEKFLGLFIPAYFHNVELFKQMTISIRYRP